VDGRFSSPENGVDSMTSQSSYGFYRAAWNADAV